VVNSVDLADPQSIDDVLAIDIQARKQTIELIH